MTVVRKMITLTEQQGNCLKTENILQAARARLKADSTIPA